MITRLLHRALFTVAVCHGLMLHADEAVPILENKHEIAPNPFDHSISIKGYWLANHEKIRATVQMDAELVTKTVKPRLNNTDTPEPLKYLYAGILACFAEPDGRAFLIRMAEKAENAEQAMDAFWVIGHLDWFFPNELKKDGPSVDMKWAESLMLDMFTKRKLLKIKDQPGEFEERQAIAITYDGGNFAEILAHSKCPDLYPILEKLWRDNPDWLEHGKMIRVFGVLEDRRAIPFLLHELRTNTNHSYNSASDALAKMKVKEAIPILLEHLDENDTYDALFKYDDSRILPAIKKALPTLENRSPGSSKDYGYGTAQILIIKLESEDKLPRLIKLAKDPNHNSNHPGPLGAIKELRDPRSIDFLHHELHHSEDLYRRIFSMRILADFSKEPEAIKSLIEAISIDFQAVAKEKNVIEDNNKTCREEISKHLARMTGQNFGTDQAKWLEYYNKTYNNF